MDIKRNTLINGVIYAAATIGAAVAIFKQWHAVEYACKPLMMLVLSSWFFFNSRRYGDRFTLLIQAGLFFSLIGDVALMLERVDHFFFVIGLGAFLLAQLCYAIAFIVNIIDVGGAEGMVLSAGLTVMLVFFSIFFTMDLMEHVTEDLQVPVIGYAVAIVIMGGAAAFRYTRTFPRSFWMVFIGTMLFIASDSLLATNRFMKELPWAHALILVLYALAQYLIAAGCLVHVLDPETIRRRQALEA
jgi:uncharacterized membrane protein YhhN